MSFIRKYKKGDKIYLGEVENRRENGKVIQRFIRYVGTETDGRVVLAESMSNVQIDAVKLYGPLAVLHHLSEEIGLREHLGPEANEIMSAAYAHCLGQQKSDRLPQWYAQTDLNSMLNVERITEDRILSGMGFLKKTDLATLHQAVHKAVLAHYSLLTRGDLYNVAESYPHGKKCGMGKMGKGSVCYLANLLMALLKFRLTPLAILPEDALEELNTIYKVYLHDSEKVFGISRLVTLTERQENILKTIDPRLLPAGKR